MRSKWTMSWTCPSTTGRNTPCCTPPWRPPHSRGEAPGFVARYWPGGTAAARDPAASGDAAGEGAAAKFCDRQPGMYLHPPAGGEVLYCTLGHCRGKYDMRPMMGEYPTVERGSWKLPVYQELMRRGIRWAAR